ncbi:ATP-binding protein [Rhizobium wenxiniae]|uniref:ATP-binding protein n=1 Tax=Rhizobium wenxiniae TaxID=1737357 RepID=UPI003C19A1C8
MPTNISSIGFEQSMSQSKAPSSKTLLAAGGGNATAGGVSFQASVGAIVCAQMISERMLDDRLALGAARATTIRFETEAPVDDLLIETDSGGYIFAQCKVTLDAGTSLESELGKTADEIVRLWQVTQTGHGQLGWDRPLDGAKDRVLIAVGTGASGSIRRDLANALASLRAGSAPLPNNQSSAINNLRGLITSAFSAVLGYVPDLATINDILKLVYVIDNDNQGNGRALIVETLASAFEDATLAWSALPVLEQLCQDLMVARRGIDAIGLRQSLARAGYRLAAPANFQADIGELRQRSGRVERDLSIYEETRVRLKKISIDRPCTKAVASAAKSGSLVLVGEPGAGKSAAVNGAAKILRAEGYEVLELAVDRLPVESLGGLQVALSLQNPLNAVLEHWPGTEPAFLFIDALDATRGGRSEAVFRALISDVLSMEDGRWRVVASIRSFDLLLGNQFRELFAGLPPDKDFVDPVFSRVRHVHIPAWSDDEFAELLADAPELATAIETGGEKLRRLAMVPFNTRLLADLISTGLEPHAFDQVGSQVELLALFWSHRVGPLGGAAEHGLRQVVRLMVERRKLQARKLDIEASSAEALDRLMAQSVLIPLPGDSEVAFRHHILFDYAASRVFIDVDDIPATSQLLLQDKGRGMMLAPALMFAFENLWRYGQPDRQAFWRAVIEFAGDSGADTIARSVAARTACELPATTADIDGFATALRTHTNQDKAAKAFSHVVGALTVRMEDGKAILTAPWCALAAATSEHVSRAPWALRTLIYVLIERVDDTSSRAHLGVASRALFWHALRGDLEQLVAIAIGFVAKTYSTDVRNSREALAATLEPSRLEIHAHEEMPWLAREIGAISASDPTFVVDIYQAIFGHSVRDTKVTSMGASRILPLTSNRRQDYEMARWSLKEAFPKLLETHPREAVAAMTVALDAYAAEEHKVSDAKVFEVSVGALTARVTQDHSHIWAWNPNEEHSDNAVSLVNAFASRLQTAGDDETLELAVEAISLNTLSLVWSRMFMAASERQGVLGEVLLPWALQSEFLRNPDTRKDALDLITKLYGSLSKERRTDFEESIFRTEFPHATNPLRGAEVFREVVFGALNVQDLATPEAHAIATAARATGKSTANDRPFRIFSSSGQIDDNWWLREKGIDVEAPANASLLAQIKLCEEATDDDQMDVDIASSAIALLARAAKDTNNAAPLVTRQAWSAVTRAIERVSSQTARLKTSPSAVATLITIILSVAGIDREPEEQVQPGDEAPTDAGGLTGQAYSDVIDACLNLCRISIELVTTFQHLLLAASSDRNPDVRLAVAADLAALWQNGRDLMWRIAGVFAQDTDERVLSFFVGSLNNLLHADPDRVEQMGLTVIHRDSENDQSDNRDLTKGLASLVTILWVSHERSSSKSILESWLANPRASYSFLSNAAFSLRGGLVLGYGQLDDNDANIRRRCQALAAQIVEVSASAIERHVSRTDRAEDDQKFAEEMAKLLDNMSDQFYFASGAFKDRQGTEDSKIDSVELRQAFLQDNQGTFRRVGDIGTPRTIYHLTEMFEFLLPGGPELVFDLAAHSLLAGGRLHGYQFEAMGADRFVNLVGRFLADYRTLFEDETRRTTLVACLEVFVEAGWPSARKLLYRLPELLR